MRKKLLVFLGVISFSFPAFSQQSTTFSVHGRIKNHSEKIIFGNGIGYDAQTGAMSLMDQSSLIEANKELPEDAQISAAANEILFTDLNDRSFAFTHVTMDNQQDLGIFVVADPDNKIGKIVEIYRTQIKDGVVDLGEIELKPLHTFRGKVQFPKMISENAAKSLVITAGYKKTYSTSNKVSAGMFNTVYVPMLGSKTFSIALPDGDYEFFYDFKDDHESYFRVTQSVSMRGRDINLIQPIQLTPKVMRIVETAAPISVVSSKMLANSWIETKNGTSFTKALQQKVVIMYFFADYCGPCFKDKGLKKYFNLAKEYRNLGVIGVHSDSYDATSSPHSIDDVEFKIEHESKWTALNQDYETARNAGANAILTWQRPELAKALFIDGYSTIIVFKDGIARKIYIAPDRDITEDIVSLLQN